MGIDHFEMREVLPTNRKAWEMLWPPISHVRVSYFAKNMNLNMCSQETLRVIPGIYKGPGHPENLTFATTPQ